MGNVLCCLSVSLEFWCLSKEVHNTSSQSIPRKVGNGSGLCFVLLHNPWQTERHQSLVSTGQFCAKK